MCLLLEEAARRFAMHQQTAGPLAWGKFGGNVTLIPNTCPFGIRTDVSKRDLHSKQLFCCLPIAVGTAPALQALTCQD